HPGLRFTHTKGLVATGTFTPAASAKTISRAAHLQNAPVPITVRFSDGSGIPTIPDNNPNASPHGMAIRFALPGGAYTDIVANSHNGFFIGNGNDFLAFLTAIAGTNEKSPHPTPIEAFLGTHPAALKVIMDSKPAAKSFENLDFYGNNAFIFVDAAGNKRAGRYQIIPAAGVVKLDSATAAKKKPNYMFDDLRAAVAKGPVKYTLYAQLANPGDQTNDGSVVWPSDRKRVKLGTISVTSIAPNNEELQKSLAFSPIILTNGITLSDDPLPLLRNAVYALSVAHRR
ncbi:MAG TPA: catalase family peroxidase, partial [Gemmatimonadaceae bacterium]|nr:catalase family peroxidase [Gemmatimonadaceae bacterium]